MRIALIADVHSNAPALEAARKAVRKAEENLAAEVEALRAALKS